MKNFLEKHFKGPGGIYPLLVIAFPMFLSCVFDMLMMFIDRLFLSRVGIVHQAAAMGGGVTSWSVTSFFAGVVGYASALVAQYYGAQRKADCLRIVRQAILLAIVSYPLVLLVHLIVIKLNVFGTHAPEEIVLETRYYWYMGFGAIISLIRFALGSLYIGIGRTKIILLANVLALFVNIFANWILIFGKLGCPALGLDGAAIGTLLAAASTAMVLVAGYRRIRRTPEWDLPVGEFFQPDKFKKLIKYGVPQGVENILGTICFTIVVSSFHSYGTEVASAITIVYSWDGFSFQPLLGIQVGVTALVGQAMGQRNPKIAERSAISGFKTAIAFAFFNALVFSLATATLVSVFAPEHGGLDYSVVRQHAIPMLRMAALYIVTDAILLVSVGALRGAGDTFWSMCIHTGNNTIISAVILLCVYKFHMHPYNVWIILVILSIISALTLLTRYALGGWKKLQII